MARADQPVSRVEWVHRDALTANNYNPNSVAPPEMALLKRSILEDGWTQPIVAAGRVIVDGFHRWTLSGDVEVYALTDGYVPVVQLPPRRLADRQISTIRHNRARGEHAVLKMADIVAGLVKTGMKPGEIMDRLGMEDEEIYRLCTRKGVPAMDIIVTSPWAKAWKPK